MGKAFRSLEFGTEKVTSLFPEVRGVTPGLEHSTAAGRRSSFVRPWMEMLDAAIQSEILPRLISAQRDSDRGADDVNGFASRACRADVSEFVELLIDDDMEQIRALADRVIIMAGGRDGLLRDLLAPAARRLGEMWDQDLCDFTTVTLGVFRLDQIMKETEADSRHNAVPGIYDHRILLLPAPGEQHSFGLGIAADTFREGGWCVCSGPSISRPKLVKLVRDEWFDIVGLSVTAERALSGLPACIRAVRAASSNPGVHIMIGGHAVINNPERARFLGADSAAPDAHRALIEANIFMKSTVTNSLRQSKTGLVDIG